MTNAEIAARLIRVDRIKDRWEVVAPGREGRKPVRWKKEARTRDEAREFCDVCRQHMAAMLDAADAVRIEEIQARMGKAK